MAFPSDLVNAVMIGVGVAVDYYAGMIQRARLWMQNSGLEWLHCLSSELSRLCRRYLVTNALFVLRAAQQPLITRFSDRKKAISR